MEEHLEERASLRPYLLELQEQSEFRPLGLVGGPVKQLEYSDGV